MEESEFILSLLGKISTPCNSSCRSFYSLNNFNCSNCPLNKINFVHKIKIENFFGELYENVGITCNSCNCVIHEHILKIEFSEITVLWTNRIYTSILKNLYCDNSFSKFILTDSISISQKGSRKDILSISNSKGETFTRSKKSIVDSTFINGNVKFSFVYTC